MKYDIILADPPWRYKTSSSSNRRIENHYPTMPLQEIKNLNIPASDDSILFLWATSPKLPEAIEVMNAWGFEYKTCAVWDKVLIGMGYWFRIQHELLLVGTNGRVSPPSPAKRIRSIFNQKRTKHSEKPAFIKDKISEWYPEKMKLEMFSRDQSLFKDLTWHVWGNEVNSDVIIS